MKRLFLLFLLAFAVSCSSGARQVQVKAADAIGKSFNTLFPSLLEQYKVDLRTCREGGAATRAAYAECAAEVDSQWAPLKDAWRRLRNAHDAYADALEAGDGNLAAYVTLVERSYCEIQKAAPASVSIPKVEGLSCEEKP